MLETLVQSPTCGLRPDAAKELNVHEGRTQHEPPPITHIPKARMLNRCLSPGVSAALLQSPLFFTWTVTTYSCCVFNSHLSLVTKHRLPKELNKPLLSVKRSAWVPGPPGHGARTLDSCLAAASSCASWISEGRECMQGMCLEAGFVARGGVCEGSLHAEPLGRPKCSCPEDSRSSLHRCEQACQGSICWAGRVCVPLASGWKNYSSVGRTEGKPRKMGKERGAALHGKSRLCKGELQTPF